MKRFSPAKINLFLAITGLRDDGYHSLVSLVAPLEFGDELEVRLIEGSVDELKCDCPGVPLDSRNLILRAAAVFRRMSGQRQHFGFDLKKRIPMGGVFGGGSSNAVAALRSMNSLCEGPLTPREMFDAACELGSDCPLFLTDGPVVMRGRGEEIQQVPEVFQWLAGLKVFLFQPGFFSSTASLFGKLKEEGTYTSPKEAEVELGELFGEMNKGRFGWDLRNDLGKLLADKYLYYDTVAGELRKEGIRDFAITGSGSGAFALVRRDSDRRKIGAVAERLLGEDGILIETRFRGNNDVRTTVC